MSESIFLRRRNGTLAEMLPSPYDSEAVLQDLLAEHPRLLAGIDMHGARRLLLVAKEAQLADSDTGPGRWSVDHLFIDDTGVPMIVEVKRSTDTRIRREVVGQMLDYAANAVLYWPIDRLRTMFDETCARKGLYPETVLHEMLGRETDTEVFWQMVSANLQAGRVRLMFVADQIPRELQRIIEFLNGQMTQCDVLGVEVRQYVGEDGEVLVPRFIGQTSAAERTKSTGGKATRQWDEASFLTEVEQRRGQAERIVAKRIIEWCRHHFSHCPFGTAPQVGLFMPVMERDRKSFRPIAVWTNGYIEVQFKTLLSLPPFDELETRRELQRRLNAIDDVHIADYRLAKLPSVRFGALVDENAFETFVSTIDWALERFASA